MNLRRCKKGHFYNAEQFLKCPYCAGIMEFKGDNDNDDDDEDTVNPFIDEELDIEDEGNTEVETPVKILDKEYDAVKTGLMLNMKWIWEWEYPIGAVRITLLMTVIALLRWNMRM